MLRDYLPVLLQIIVAVGFAGSALVLSVLLGKTGRRSRIKDSPYECGMVPMGKAQSRFSVKFYLIAMLFILFDLEIVFMYPWAVIYRDMIHEHPVIFWSMLSFVSILMIGYIYALRKGVLDWKSCQWPGTDPSPSALDFLPLKIVSASLLHVSIRPPTTSSSPGSAGGTSETHTRGDSCAGGSE